MTEAVKPQLKDASQRIVAAFVFSNFVIGTGVLIATGMLKDLAAGLSVSLAQAGQLIGVAGLMIAIGAPVLATLTSRVDRRVLLVASLGVYTVGHAACMFAPDYATLLPLRVIAVIGAAVFTPQAAATVGLMIPRARQGAALATLMLGWSLASVAGMPLGTLIAGYFGWRAGFGLIAVLSLIAALWVALVTPSGLRIAPLSPTVWRQVASHQRLTRILLVTLIAAAGQFTLMTYITPSLASITDQRNELIAALMALLGAAGVVGNTWASRRIDRQGTDRVAFVSILSMLIGLALWCVARLQPVPMVGWTLLTASIVLWGLGGFASNSAQQARLYQTEPALASASIALNSSCMFAGQTIGATLGGLSLSWIGLESLPWIATTIMVGALMMSAAAARTPPGVIASRRTPC